MELEMVKRDHEAVLTFLEKMYSSRRKDIYLFWKDFLKYELKVAQTRRILIAGPSHIVGMGTVDQLGNLDVKGRYWEEYISVKR